MRCANFSSDTFERVVSAGAPVGSDSAPVQILSGEICRRKARNVIAYVLCMLCCSVFVFYKRRRRFILLCLK